MTIIFLNDQFISQNAAGISINDRGFLLGDGIFETIRIYKGKALFLNRHYQRLTNSARLLDISLPYTEEQLRSIINKLLIDNQLIEKEAIVRITLSRGSSERGLAIQDLSIPTCLVTVFPYTPIDEHYKLIISSIRRNEFSPLSTIKSLNYLDNILAYDQAIKQQANDALLLNTSGNIACTTMANIFIVKNYTLLTPALSDGALPGIMRSLIIEYAQSLHINVVEKSIVLSELESADAVFITNAVQGIKKIITIKDILKEFSMDNRLVQQLIERLKDSV